MLYHFRHKARYWLKIAFFTFPAFDAPVRGFPSEYYYTGWYGTTAVMVMLKKFDDTFSHFDRIPACDDGQTSFDSIIRAVYSIMR